MNKIITKNLPFVIFLSGLAFFLASCSIVSSGVEKNGRENATSIEYEKARVVGTIRSKEIRESSGITASRCQTDVFWTHNDSGDSAFVYAINSKGQKLGTFRIKNAKNFDWEDIASHKTKNGQCFLFIGDIGNNTRRRNVFTIYKVKEPKIAATDKKTTKKNPRIVPFEGSIKFEYPDLRRDSETLLVHPQSGDIYVLTKRLSEASGVYKLNAGYSFSKTNKLKKITNFSVPAIPNGFLTGGEISPDGKRIVICDYFNAYEIILNEKTKKFDDIWKQKPAVIELGKRKQGEAVGYSADGNSIFATSEKRNSPVIRVNRKK